MQDLGRKAATDVQVMHETRVDHFQLHPRRDSTDTTAADGTHTINVGSLGPKEWLQIRVPSHTTRPVLVGVRSKDGAARNVCFQPVRAILFISHANGML